MSECPILNYLAGAVEVEAMEKAGSHAGPKHFVGNDQEFYREGLVCFFNEQALSLIHISALFARGKCSIARSSAQGPSAQSRAAG